MQFINSLLFTIERQRKSGTDVLFGIQEKYSKGQPDSYL